jgi:hypothetical protein
MFVVFSGRSTLFSNEFLKAFCAATTSLHRRRDVGDVARDRSARSDDELPSPVAALLCGADLCFIVVLR